MSVRDRASGFAMLLNNSSGEPAKLEPSPHLQRSWPKAGRGCRSTFADEATASGERSERAQSGSFNLLHAKAATN
jgi:hypothetical protein